MKLIIPVWERTILTLLFCFLRCLVNSLLLLLQPPLLPSPPCCCHYYSKKFKLTDSLKKYLDCHLNLPWLYWPTGILNLNCRFVTGFHYSLGACICFRSAPSSPEISPQSSPRPHRPNSDRLSILTKLVRKGEKKGLFVEKMPVRIYQVKHSESGN